ncbi:MAG TPA: alpha/beta hydrolase-fold protein [Rhodanobacteraceae bacterium]|nr:alpha/beta hydrolase-fold protein [Rhodanobacteraceae bacterium]
MLALVPAFALAAQAPPSQPAGAPTDPAAAATALVPAWVAEATREATSPRMPAHRSFRLHSARLGEDRHINVYLPPGYASDARRRYPVLYMPDGGMREDFPHVATDVDRLIRAGQMRPMIVVGIENTQRRRDMTAPTSVASDRTIAPRVGGAAAFRAFIAEELMPDVRKRYRSNGHTAIIGESLAGLFVIETLFAQPRLFDTWIALSPSLWWNDQALVHGAEARLRAWPRGLQRRFVFASAGDDDVGDAVGRLQAALRAAAPKALEWTCLRRPDLRHATIYRALSPSLLGALFPPDSQ